VTHRSGFFLVVGLNLLLIFDPLLILRVLSFNLFPKKPASRFFAYVSVFFFFLGERGGGGGKGVSLWSLVCGVDSLFLCDDLLLVFLFLFGWREN
jgi:hypothetical protein